MPDLRIVFVVLLVFTAVLFTLRQGPVLGFSDIKTMLLDFILVPVSLLTLLVFIILITGTDHRQLLLQGIALISKRTVNFVTAVPAELENSLAAKIVERQDTDGDGFDEWVVLYEYDLQTGPNPVQVAIYDNDRGNPPIIYPYMLTVPDRDYISERVSRTGIELTDITVDKNGPPDNPNLPEIVVTAPNQLSIFRFNSNTKLWEAPTDTPPRYQPIGAFKSNGGISINTESAGKEVTVIDRDKFDRSQLAMRSIYALNSVTNSYWDNFDSTQLAAPTMATVDFFTSPPEDVVNTSYPEKIVLAFYAATCKTTDKTLCRHANRVSWEPEQFLSENGDARGAPPSYFGLNSLSQTRNLLVSNIQYFPGFETATGTENRVEITFNADGSPVEVRSYEMALEQGKWRILKRVPPTNSLASDALPETEINTVQ